MEHSKQAAMEAKKKKETKVEDEKVVVRLDESDSEKLATSLRLIAEKLDRQDSSMNKMEESIKKNSSEIDELKKRVDSFGTSTEKCQNLDDLNSYIDRRISDKFEEEKSSLDRNFDKKVKAFLDSLQEKAEEPKTTTAQSPWRTVRQKIGKIVQLVIYDDGRKEEKVVGDVIEERTFY